jgi:putative transposase
VRERVARSRELVAGGRKPAVVARVLRISRQAIYRTPARRPASARRQGAPSDPVERRSSRSLSTTRPTATAWCGARRKLGQAVNRKRVLRLMREQRLTQRRRPLARRRRPGYFRVWLAPRTALPREGSRSRSSSERPPGAESDRACSRSAHRQGSAFTARAFKIILSELGIAHRRGGYPDLESQASIET